MKLLLFDLDGTLLDNDKNISKRTLTALQNCRTKGILIGVSTSRSEQNSLTFLSELKPDILIASGGALVKKGNEYIYKAEMSSQETRMMIETARKICGDDCEITIDTLTTHYWNYKTDPKHQDKSWGDSVYSDFSDFNQPSLKICVEIFDRENAEDLKAALPDCDCVRFSDGFWYKFTKAGVTKERAIHMVCSACDISLEDITAFGDDFADIGMRSTMAPIQTLFSLALIPEWRRCFQSTMQPHRLFQAPSYSGIITTRNLRPQFVTL